jgi:hypothetical protein
MRILRQGEKIPQTTPASTLANVVARGGVEPSTFRFSGLGMIVR